MSRSKQFKPVKSADELMCGQIYIRAVVNCYGEFWYEIIRLDTNPKMMTNKTFKNPFFGVKTSSPRMEKNIFKEGMDYFIASLVTPKDGYGHVLFRFSNKVKSYLNSNMGDVWQFLEAIHNRPFDSYERTKLASDWSYNEWTNNEYFQILR